MGKANIKVTTENGSIEMDVVAKEIIIKQIGEELTTQKGTV